MEQKYLNIEVIKNDRKYMFYIPDGAPLGETFDACYETLQKILNFAKEVAENTKPTIRE